MTGESFGDDFHVITVRVCSVEILRHVKFLLTNLVCYRYKGRTKNYNDCKVRDILSRDINCFIMFMRPCIFIYEDHVSNQRASTFMLIY